MQRPLGVCDWGSGEVLPSLAELAVGGILRRAAVWLSRSGAMVSPAPHPGTLGMLPGVMVLFLWSSVRVRVQTARCCQALGVACSCEGCAGAGLLGLLEGWYPPAGGCTRSLPQTPCTPLQSTALWGKSCGCFCTLVSGLISVMCHVSRAGPGQGPAQALPPGLKDWGRTLVPSQVPGRDVDGKRSTAWGCRLLLPVLQPCPCP